MFGRSRPAGGTGDLGLLEERLGQANEGLGKFGDQLEAQNAEFKQQQLQLQEAKEVAAVSRTQLEAVSRERDELKCPDCGDWNHGFNSGMLAALRFVIHAAEDPKEAQEDFPMLDT